MTGHLPRGFNASGASSWPSSAEGVSPVGGGARPALRAWAEASSWEKHNTREDKLGCIGQLSAALNHDYLGHRYFVIVTAYLDESGTHEGSPKTVMSGFVGNVHQWRGFEKKVRGAFREFHVEGFHAKDFMNRSGEFRGWNDDKRTAFLVPIHKATETFLELGFSVILNNDDYEKIYASDPQPKRGQKDSKYGMCFRYSLMFLDRMHPLASTGQRAGRSWSPKPVSAEQSADLS